MKKKIEQEEEELIEEEEKEYDLYGDLGLTSAATQQEIKSSYYRLAMKWHPDRNENNQEATEKFQSIGKAYEILSDEKKRKYYDKTGRISDEDYLNKKDVNWEEYFNALYKKVTTEDIETFEKEYKNSKEELKDLKEVYLNFKGDMEEIMENIMLSDESDFERFENIFKEMIKNKEIPKYKAFSKKVSKETRLEVAKQESIEAELSLKELKEKINERKLIRRDDFESMTNHLASKYNEENDENIFQPEPTEEEFQKARSRLTPSPSPKKRKRNEETPSRDAKKKK